MKPAEPRTSPRPWRVHKIEHQVLQQQVRGLCHAIFDSRDRIVAIPTSCREDADFIVDAVNEHKHHGKAISELIAEYDRIEAERERLRGALRSIVTNLTIHIKCGRAVAPGDHVSFPILEAQAYIDEARSALGTHKEDPAK